MSHHTENEGRINGLGVEPDAQSQEDCDGIKDPLRRALCKVCGMPVLGEAPFCAEHEPPVP